MMIAVSGFDVERTGEIPAATAALLPVLGQAFQNPSFLRVVCF